MGLRRESACFGCSVDEAKDTRGGARDTRLLFTGSMFHRVRRDEFGDDVVMRLVNFAVGELEAMRAKKDDVKLRCGTPKVPSHCRPEARCLGPSKTVNGGGGELQPQIPSGAR
jgi:hypothetical protein